MKELCKQYKTQILLIIYGILSFPVFYGLMQNDLDPSWRYALNKFTSFNNVKFGSDVVFTYGPLGFLDSPMYINGNFVLATFIYIAMWASTMFLFYKLLKKNSNNIYMTILSLLVLFIGSPAGSSDLYIQYCVLMALAVLWIDMNDIFAAVFLVAATTIAFFFKFSIAVAVVGTFALFMAAKISIKEYRRIWILFLPCVTIPICYLIYNPTLRGFMQFIKGSWEVAQGYNTAMSTDQHDQYVFWMFLLMIIYIAIMISQLIFKKKQNFLMMLWLAPCLFMSYKHGYVRADNLHVAWAYVEILATFSIVIMLFDVKGLYAEMMKKTKAGMLQAGLMISLLLVAILDYNNNLEPPWINLTSRIQKISEAIYYMSEDKYIDNMEWISAIPDDILGIIEDSSYTSYPWEITFIEPTGNVADNFVPLPVLQMYSAYTPYLDNITAALFNGENAPEYIIFKFDTKDGRIPLLEAPSTWKAIQDNYFLNSGFDNNYYLLQHKTNTTYRSGSSELIEVKKSDIVTLEGYSEAKIYANLTVWGKLVNIIWKIPEVRINITYTDGTVKEGRVLIDNLVNGITVNGLPYDNDTLNNALLSDGLACGIQSISFSGDGLKYYNDNLTVEYIKYSNE